MDMNSGGQNPIDGATNEISPTSNLGLAEILQHFCQANRTGRITFFSQSVMGQIYIQYGQVLHAQGNAAEGSQSIYQMLQWPPGTHQFEESLLPQKRTIHSSLEQLLIKGALNEDAASDPATSSLVSVEEERGDGTVIMTRLQGGQPKLTVVEGELANQSFDLNKEITRIGRIPENEIVLSVPSVSSRHCLVIIRGSDVIVQDLNSYNGTYVNGEKVTERILQLGDFIQLGSIKLKFESVFKRPKLAPSNRTASKEQTPVQKKIALDKVAKEIPKTESLQAPEKKYVTGNAPIVYHELKKAIPEPKPKLSRKITVLASAGFLLLVIIFLCFFFLHKR